jgi:DNA polymerase III epsilon subunit-like protein
MNPGADEVIELGMLKLEYGQDGQYSVLDSFDRLQQPKKPIPAHITAITGITDEEVAAGLLFWTKPLYQTRKTICAAKSMAGGRRN